VIETAATVDGRCSEAEYSNAAIGPAVVTMTGLRPRDVYVIHDFDHLWVCFSARPASWTGGVALYVDPDADSEKASSGDFVVVVPFPAEKQVEKEMEAGPWAAFWRDGWTGSDPGGWTAASSFSPDGSTWSAEIRIAAATLGSGWNGTIGLALEWGGQVAGGTAIASWPEGEIWGQATLTNKSLFAFPQELDLGDVKQGAQSKQALYFHNLSTRTSTLYPVTWSISGIDASAFQFDPAWLKTWIGVVFFPGCCSWPVSEIVFTPMHIGLHQATLTLWTPADNSPHTIRLRGNGDCTPYCP
jgi:hypothetical protein